MLKAVLAYHQFTHRLADLIDSSRDERLSFPPELEEICYLTPFAVEFHHDFFGDEDDSFAASTTLELLKDLRKWIVSIVS